MTLFLTNKTRMHSNQLCFRYLITCFILLLHLLTSTLVSGHKCQDNPLPHFCNISSKFNYTTLQPFTNSLDHDLGAAKAELSKYYILLNDPSCRDKIQLFLCPLYLPICFDYSLNDHNLPPIRERNAIFLPCRDECERAMSDECLGILRKAKMVRPKEWDCTKFRYRRDDSLCIMDDTRMSSSSSSSSSSPSFSPSSAHSAPAPNDSRMILEQPSVCEANMFDCKIRQGGMHAYCIDKALVCDRNVDCKIDSINETLTEGRDEIGCNYTISNKCLDGQHHCDGRCISIDVICDGKPDCSDASDEQQCHIGPNIADSKSYITEGLFSVVILCLVILSIISVKSRCSSDPKEKHPRILPLQSTPERSSHTSTRSPSLREEEQLNQENQSHLYAPLYPHSNASYPGDYDYTNQGGRTGTSSVYYDMCGRTLPVMYYASESSEYNERGSAPPAPPPTPFEPEYSTLPVYSNECLMFQDMSMKPSV